MTKNITRYLTAALLLSVTVFSSQGCDDPVAFRSDEDKITEANSASVFRNIFYNYLRKDHSLEEIQKMIFVSLPELERVPENPGSTNPFEELHKTYSSHLPVELYENGKTTAFTKDAKNIKYLKGKEPVTFIVIPGIFGEFLDNAPFQSILDRKGSFYKKWNPVLEKNTGKAYQLSELGNIETSLDKLASIGSIDDEKGNARINMILLRPLKGSLETFGTLRDNTKVYQQRLNKIFSIIDAKDTPNLYILGYSRGLSVGMDLIVDSRARAREFQWSKRIRGIVGLAGTFYGSDIAENAVYNPESTDNQTILLLQELVANLSEDGTPEAEENNKKLFAEAMVKFAVIQKQALDNTPVGLLLEKEAFEMDSIDLPWAGGFLYRMAIAYFKADVTGEEHFNNVKRFRLLSREVIEAINTLTNQGAMQWWRDNVLPADVKIFSITGTMPAESKPEQDFSKLLYSPYYGTDMPDFQMILRGNYYTTLNASGVQLNDSQVTMYRSRFWPGLASVINPEQKTLAHYYLAPLGTHHWGLGFTQGIQSQNIDKNPFPRDVLMESVGTFIAGLD